MNHDLFLIINYCKSILQSSNVTLTSSSAVYIIGSFDIITTDHSITFYIEYTHTVNTNTISDINLLS